MKFVMLLHIGLTNVLMFYFFADNFNLSSYEKNLENFQLFMQGQADEQELEYIKSNDIMRKNRV